jgi:Ca2+-binding RTX toxin-like protein
VAPELTIEFVEASGTGGSGGVLAARSVLPLVAYPGAAPCASDDAARTSLGRPVRVAVLANDVAPTGGVLDAASVTVETVSGGSFSVNTADGSLTFTPDAGFAGTVTTRYWVYDRWDIGVSATVTFTVEAGCTITGAPGVTVIEGTDGDDVICVPDPDDWDAFHVIDARAGDDVILGGDGVDWIYGGAGADVVYGRDGRDVIHGGAEADTIHGGRDFDTIHSDDLADRIVDDVGGYELLLTRPTRPEHRAPVVSDDMAYAMPGETLDIAVLANDHDRNGNLVAASLSITRDPELGSVRVVALSPYEVLVRYTAGETDGVDSFTYEVCDTLGACATAEVAVTVGTSHCTIVGTDGDDILRGTPGDDVICGLGGHDVISGLGGNDVLIGGPGNDALYGGFPIPVGVGDGVNVLFGGLGHDTLVGGYDTDTCTGGATTARCEE